MSGRIVKEVANGAKKISIVLAEDVRGKGFKRAIDAIDPAVVDQTAEKVANAVKASTMLTANQKARASKIVITYDLACNSLESDLLIEDRSMPHPSPEDPDEHSTVYIKDSDGKNICVGHVASDSSKQKVSPASRLFRVTKD